MTSVSAATGAFAAATGASFVTPADEAVKLAEETAGSGAAFSVRELQARIVAEAAMNATASEKFKGNSSG